MANEKGKYNSINAAVRNVNGGREKQKEWVKSIIKLLSVAKCLIKKERSILTLITEGKISGLI